MAPATPLRIAAMSAVLAAAAAGAAPASTNVPTADVEPPRCDDARVLANVTRAYADAALNAPVAALRRIQPPRQVALLDHVAAPDTPGNRVLFHGTYPWGHSRFCEARLDLAGNGTETAYWRLDARKGGPEDKFQLSPCFAAWMRQLSTGHQDCSFVRP